MEMCGFISLFVLEGIRGSPWKEAAAMEITRNKLLLSHNREPL